MQIHFLKPTTCYGYAMKYTQQNMKKPEINTEDLLKDLNNIMNIVDQFENIDLEKDDLNKFKNKVENVEKTLKDKYKDIIEEFGENVDTEE